jgi:transposase
MPAKRELTMRQLRYMLRLHHDGMSARAIGRTLGMARTIQDNLRRAQASGIAWPLSPELTDDVLEQLCTPRTLFRSDSRLRPVASRHRGYRRPPVLPVRRLPNPH